jgi:hypothetical protein
MNPKVANSSRENKILVNPQITINKGFRSEKAAYYGSPKR